MSHRGLAAALAALSFAGAGCGADSSTSPGALHYSATLAADNERQKNADGSPLVVTSPATGEAVFTLLGDTLAYRVDVANLTAPAVASHIHAGTADVSGPIVNGFVVVDGVTTGTVASGKIALSTLVPGAGQVSGDSLRALLANGHAYVNVHTSTYRGGEIRGQIQRQSSGTPTPIDY